MRYTVFLLLHLSTEQNTPSLFSLHHLFLLLSFSCLYRFLTRPQAPITLLFHLSDSPDFNILIKVVPSLADNLAHLVKIAMFRLVCQDMLLRTFITKLHVFFLPKKKGGVKVSVETSD